jgi:hypothetical protein
MNNDFGSINEPDDSSAQFQGMEQDPVPQPLPIEPVVPEVQPKSQEGDKPNVILSKDHPEGPLPEGLVNIGNIGIVMPDTDSQESGFYVPAEEASVLVAQFRQFKFMVDKGQKTPSVRIGE